MTYNQKVITSMVFFLNKRFIGATKVDAILALYKQWNINKNSDEDCKRIAKAVKQYFKQKNF